MNARQHVNIFVAYSDEVDEERQALEAAAEEINRTLGSLLDLHLAVKSWVRDAVPGLHDRGAQALINPILDEAHVVVAVIWNRIGTGLQEELERTIVRWRASKQPQLLIYFCTRPSVLDTPEALEQRRRVVEFRSIIEREKLGLYWRYGSVDEFEGFVRQHLTRYATSLRPVTNTVRSATEAQAAAGSAEGGEEAWRREPGHDTPADQAILKYLYDHEVRQGFEGMEFRDVASVAEALDLRVDAVTESFRVLDDEGKLELQESTLGIHGATLTPRGFDRCLRRTSSDYSKLVERIAVAIVQADQGYGPDKYSLDLAASLNVPHRVVKHILALFAREGLIKVTAMAGASAPDLVTWASPTLKRRFAPQAV